MMKQKNPVMSYAAAALLAAGVASAGPALAGQVHATLPVSMSQARAAALKAAPGTVKDAELEKPEGTQGPRYAFEIQTSGGLRELVVDAQSGKVIGNKAESGETEKAEGKSGDDEREAEREHEQGGEQED